MMPKSIFPLDEQSLIVMKITLDFTFSFIVHLMSR